MTELTRAAASDAVTPLGWRMLLSSLAASVPVPSLGQGLAVAVAAAEACGGDGEHLRADVRADRVELVLQTAGGLPTGRDVELAGAITDAVAGLGLSLAPATGGPVRPVQQLEVAIDTLDLAKIKPFWAAVLGYESNARADDELVDPARQGPTFWFQQMDEPRPQRNRIHFDITVPHDDAQPRIQAALAAGGTLVSEAYAPSFWILADAEGNEVCVCTWQDRDERA
jgi:4a-hydroxytetrahydrobiopterin dehydratase